MCVVIVTYPPRSQERPCNLELECSLLQNAACMEGGGSEGEGGGGRKGGLVKMCNSVGV